MSNGGAAGGCDFQNRGQGFCGCYGSSPAGEVRHPPARQCGKGHRGRCHGRRAGGELNHLFEGVEASLGPWLRLVLTAQLVPGTFRRLSTAFLSVDNAEFNTDGAVNCRGRTMQYCVNWFGGGGGWCVPAIIFRDVIT